MKNIKLTFHDYSHVKVHAPISILKEIHEHFSFFADGYQFSNKFIYGSWDGKIRLFEIVDKLLPIGLVGPLTSFATDNNYNIEIGQHVEGKTDINEDELIDWIASKTIYSGNKIIEPYSYQINAVVQGIQNQRRILNLPTSAGKSLIQALLAKWMIEHSELNVLVLVPSTTLVMQMKNDFVDYKLFEESEIDEVRGGAKQKGARVTVSTWQSAIKKPKEWFAQFGMLLNDEMHLATGKSISTIVKQMDMCPFKIGLSGSLRDGKANLMQYVALFGGVYNPVSTRELMDKGLVAPLKINTLFLKYPKEVSSKLRKLSTDYKIEIEFITKLTRRTEVVCNLAKKVTGSNQNAFVMFRYKHHGKAIYDSIKASGHKKIFYVAGEISTEERDKLKKYAEENTGVIIIASYGVFSTGVSIKNLHHVILAHPVKSKTTVLQTIGRLLRLHPSKKFATLWDLIDDMSEIKNGQLINVNHTLSHGIDRIARYSSERFDYTQSDIHFMK